MLAGILKSEVSIKIMDSFVEMRKFISVNKSLFEKAVTFYFAKILLILCVLCYTNFNSWWLNKMWEKHYENKYLGRWKAEYGWIIKRINV